MTIFRSRGFDTLIGKGTSITGELGIAPNSTAVIDGDALVTSIFGVENVGDKVTKTTLRVSGTARGPVNAVLNIEVHNVIVTGKIECETIRVEGTLAVKAGATLKATKILYRELIIETGAIVHGQMFHLDHVSEGEKT